MKAVILGADGYLGWPLSLALALRGHEVTCIDNLATRRCVREVGSTSGIPIASMEKRIASLNSAVHKGVRFIKADITEGSVLREVIRKEKPDAVVHFAEQRSAPYSMISERNAIYTMENNIIGTLKLIYAVKETSPNTHILKMGTMGEFGTPNFDIPESAFVDAKIKGEGKYDKILTPKWAGSWYHWTKVHDTHNMLYANSLWGCTITDVMQGPVYGTRTEEITKSGLNTRFDFDGVWGTVINKFCVQAVLGMPLIRFGKGGQVRGFISLQDSINALVLLLEKPPAKGEYRAVNQFMELFSTLELEKEVKLAASRILGKNLETVQIEDPRVEKENHYYKPRKEILERLGFKLTWELKDNIPEMLKDLQPHVGLLSRYKDVIKPTVKWR